MSAWSQSATADPSIIDAVELVRAKAAIAVAAADRAEAAADASGSGSASDAAASAAAAQAAATTATTAATSSGAHDASAGAHDASAAAQAAAAHTDRLAADQAAATAVGAATTATTAATSATQHDASATAQAGVAIAQAAAAHADRVAGDQAAAAAAASAERAVTAAADMSGYLGPWRADTNNPPIASGVGVHGQWRDVVTAGDTVIDGEGPWVSGDKIKFVTSAWIKVPNDTGYRPDYPGGDDEHGGDLAWAALGEDDELLFGVDEQQRLVAKGLVIEEPEDEDAECGETLVIRSPYGVYGSYDVASQRFLTFGIEVTYASAADDERWLIPVMELNNGVPIAVDDRGGTLLRLSEYAETWLRPSLVRGNHRVIDVKVDGERGVVATTQDADKWVFPFYQQRIVPTTSAIAVAPRIRNTIIVGQSHSSETSGKPGTPLWSRNSTPYHLATLSNSTSHGGGALWSLTAFPSDDLIPLWQFTTNGVSPALALGETLIAFERAANIDSDVRVINTSWLGDTPLDKFFPATPGNYYMHENICEMLRRTKAVSQLYPHAYSFDVELMIQGETPATTPWDVLAADYVDTVLPLHAEAAGQTTPPAFLFFQTNSRDDDPTPSGSELQQLAFARARTSPAVSCIGPMYEGELHDGTDPPTHIHLNDLARLRFMERAAIAHRRVTKGLSWNPLWSVVGGVTRVGNVWTIQLQAPPDCTSLTWDTTVPCTNRGYVIRPNGGNSPVIQSVVIAGLTVVITTDVAPTGDGGFVEYAYANDQMVGRPMGRGQLCAPDPETSPWHARGFDVPEHPLHPCMRFKEPYT